MSSNTNIHYGKPGKVTFTAPDGTTVNKLLNVVETSTSKSSFNVSIPFNGDTLPLRELIIRMALLRQQIANYDVHLKIDGGVIPTFEYKPSEVSGNTDTSFVNLKLSNEILDSLTSQMVTAEQKVVENQKRNECIKETLDEQSSNSSLISEKAITGLVGQALAQVVGLINQQLPSYAQASVSDSGITIGPVLYNAANNEFILNGNTYDAALNGGLDIFNSKLPDYLRISLTDLGLDMGGKSISLTDLVKPQPYSLFGDMTITTDQTTGVVTITANASKYEIGRVVGDLATKQGLRVTTAGINSLNKVLPDSLQIKGSFDKLSVGPVVINTVDGVTSLGVTADSVAPLAQTIINQLPAPVATVARSAWSGLSKQLFAVPADAPTDNTNQSINVSSSPCKENISSVPFTVDLSNSNNLSFSTPTAALTPIPLD